MDTGKTRNKEERIVEVDMSSAIGGTIGLLTGFSIISGVEIGYFVIKMTVNALKSRVQQ